jgi:hypothetical protein
MAASDIYDFESILPTAIKPILVNAGLSVWIITDNPQYQKARPRVEIVYRHIGEEVPRRWSATLSDGTRRGVAFLGELRLHAITDADAPGKLTHAIYRTQVRSLLAAGLIENSVNEVELPFHKIQWIQPGNEDTGIRQQDGYQQTTFPFQVKLSIQANAFSQL